MFQASQWSWKRVAARLLLVPVLAGASAATAPAQQKTIGGSMPVSGAPRSAGPVMAQSQAPAGRPGDPKLILKDGRKALAEGRFNDAQDLAQAAAANNPTGKWGLFDDTPNALLNDVQAARLKSDKGQAENLLKQAKSLLVKPAANDAERIYNLDAALQMARRADQLHGPYSVWDLGDRPDKMVKDIEAARAKLKGVGTPLPNAGVAGQPANQPFASALPQAPNVGVRPAGGPAQNAPVSPAAGTKYPNTTLPTGPAQSQAVDAKKAAALKLMAEGKAHADRAEFAEAKAKFLEADKCGAVFTVHEPNPGFAIQELNVKGSAAISTLVREAHNQMAKKDFEKADAALATASKIVTALSLFARPVEEARTALKQMSGGKYSGTPIAGVVSTETPLPTGPTAPVQPVAANPMTPVVVPSNPMLPPGAATVSGTKPAAGGTVTGRQLLDQAAMAYKAGDLDQAALLARQAYNQGSQAEASALLNSIDAEKLTMKRMAAEKSFDAAVQAHAHKDYGHALSVCVLIDPNLLPADKKARMGDLMAACRVELDKSAGPNNGVVATGATQLPMANPSSVLDPLAQPPAGPMGTNPPGSARVGSSDPNNLANQVDAMRKVTFQKLRSDGLKVQADAQAAFGRGDTDVAIQMLVDFTNKVRTSDLEPASVALLLRPIDSRLEMFRVMKGQADALTREKKEKAEAKDLIVGRGAAEEQRKAEVQKLVRDSIRYQKSNDYANAEKAALQAKQLDPDNEAVAALAHYAKMTRRAKENEALKDAKEKLVYGGLQNAEHPGQLVTTENPVAFEIERVIQSRKRGTMDDVYLRSRTPREYQIELQLDQPVSVEFNQTPLELAIEDLRTLSKLPIMFDHAAMESEGISAVKPVTVKPGTAISVRNLLHVTLEQAGLSFVIEHDMIKITTIKKSKGRLFTKVFSVADLVTPIPNFALPDYANLDKMLSRNPLNNGNVQLQGMNGGGLGGGQVPPGAYAGQPGIANQMQFAPPGTIQTTPASPSGNGNGPSPLNGVGTVGHDRNTKHEQLIKLITGMIRPYSWDGMGGNGRVEYYDIGSALVVNQTADVIREVADLLEALRRLQDLAVAVEIRIVSLSETFFERMGVDFSMNIKTDSNTAKFEPQLTSGVFRPEPFINNIATKGTTVGLTPAGSFTPDLDVPIKATSFNYAIPGFGGYPNNPGFNGGVSLGLAFLNDIQVYMFMEAAQGDRRVNVMQAPKLTLFNGQTSTLSVTDLSFFVTQVSVVSVNGQIVFIPSNTPLPGPDTNFSIGVQAVVSADRRFVRLNLPVTLAAQSGATVPLFPVTTFITPVFEGGSQGVPIPFTQFLQQPSFTTLDIQTTVVCPDGGTVLLGGLKTLQEGRNEFGPPFLSKIPYLNRLFKNVGIGRETRHLMIMVTPRIIINAEEEINQTEGRVFTGGSGQ